MILSNKPFLPRFSPSIRSNRGIVLVSNIPSGRDGCKATAKFQDGMPNKNGRSLKGRSDFVRVKGLAL
jgi:hypothetical protein